MKKKFMYSCLAVAMGAGTGYAASVLAQAKPDTLVKQRQAVMTLHGKYFYGDLRPMAQGKIPYDAARAARAAGFIEALSRMPWDGFAASTKDIKTRATPVTFTDTAKFKEAQDQYMAETAKLLAATRGGDEAAVKAQIGAVGKSCDSCHETFRESR